MRRVLVPFLVGGALLLPRVGVGEEPLELAWDAPKGCPTQAEVLGEVKRIVGAGEVRRNVQAEAHVAQQGDRWVITLRTMQGGGAGERSLEGHTCKAVASAAALVLALTLQTDAPEVTPPPSASASASAPPPLASTAVPRPPPTVPPPPRHPPLSLVMRAAGGVALGLVPDASGAVSGAIGVRYGRFEASGTFGYVAETSRALAARPQTGGQFTLLSTSLLACLAPLVSTDYFLEVWGCVGGEGEWMLASAFGDVQSHQATYGWFAPVFVPRIAYVPTPKVALFLETTLSFPVERPRFTIEGLEPVYRVPPIGLRIALGVELRF